MKPACGPSRFRLAMLDGFIDGGMVGNAVQPENLIESQSKQICKSRGLSRRMLFCGR